MWIDRMHDPSKRYKNPGFKIQDRQDKHLQTYVLLCKQFSHSFDQEQAKHEKDLQYINLMAVNVTGHIAVIGTIWERE